MLIVFATPLFLIELCLEWESLEHYLSLFFISGMTCRSFDLILGIFGTLIDLLTRKSSFLGEANIMSSLVKDFISSSPSAELGIPSVESS